jgi:hypothetical protein
LGLCEGYQEKTADVWIQQHCITEVTTTVTEALFVNIWHKIEYCSSVYRATNGAHTEIYYVTKETLWVLFYWIVRECLLHNKYVPIYNFFFFLPLSFLGACMYVSVMLLTDMLEKMAESKWGVLTPIA